MSLQVHPCPLQFQSTPSARRATEPNAERPNQHAISIHALREEGDWLPVRSSALRWKFQSTPSARRATHEGLQCLHLHGISIHALREEGDAAASAWQTAAAYFNPRPPRGGRQLKMQMLAAKKKFQSTPSARRATRGGSGRPCTLHNFNPRPPRGGRQTQRLQSVRIGEFQSTPSARRATPADAKAVGEALKFQSTPSARRATNADL